MATPALPTATSTICGSSILPRTNGRGWVGAARSPVMVVVAIRGCTARWGQPQQGTSPAAARVLPPGSTAAAISGSLGAGAKMPTTVLAISTTCGSSIPQRTNGRGWVGAARCLVLVAAVLAFTARWVHLPKETSPGAATLRTPGPTAAVTSGSLGARAKMPTTVGAVSTTYGCSVLRRTNGRGWAEAGRCRCMAVMRACMAAWVCLPPGTFPAADLQLRVGSTAAGTYGFLGALDTMPTTMSVLSTTYGSISLLPRRYQCLPCPPIRTV